MHAWASESDNEIITLILILFNGLSEEHLMHKQLLHCQLGGGEGEGEETGRGERQKGRVGKRKNGEGGEREAVEGREKMGGK